MSNKRRHRLLVQSSVIVLCVVAAKLVAHFLGWEQLSINPLFSGIVAGNVFLMGFLLNGVLSDFKESERYPGELGTGLENLAQEIRAIGLSHPEAEAQHCQMLLAGLGADMLKWFHKGRRTAELLEHLNELTPHFAAFERCAQATMVARLKQEQGNLRRVLTRIHTIRETSFVASGYLLADLITVLLCLGLVFSKIEPFAESLFYVGVISYLMVYLLLLIRDLDNPFAYYDRRSGEDVSLKPLEDAVARLQRMGAASQREQAAGGVGP